MATKTRGAARFAQMLSDLSLSQREAARRIGNRSQAYVSLLLQGDRMPDLPAALGIQKLSREWPQGPIEPSEWEEVTEDDDGNGDAPRTGTEG
jgi:transcriptional regulator with XRE-family HTH domain